MALELLFLLLPVAAFSGWLLGRDSGKKRQKLDCPPPLNSRYFQGLNYLLDEQPDAALDVLISISELDHESVEIQFALAALFLRRGEVERAIRIHQNLIARPTLSPEYRHQALYGLAMDYMSAGLLDRAENLFRELLDDARHGFSSRRQLLEIFQQEKEWEKAIELARSIRGEEESALAPAIAQYYCELAEQALQKADFSLAAKRLRSAVDRDNNCVRASLLEADLFLQQEHFPQALAACKRVEQQDPEYLPLILEPSQRAYAGMNRDDDYLHYLNELLERHYNSHLNQALVSQLLSMGEQQAAEVLVNKQLERQPSLQGVACLLMVIGDKSGNVAHWQRLTTVVSSLLQQKPRFQCRHCGYQGRSLLWHCPGCKQWNTIKPV